MANKTLIATLTGETFVPGSIVAPVIESGDCTGSGSNVTSTSLSVAYPAYVSGDLLVLHLSLWTTGNTITVPSGPNGETLSTLVNSYSSAAADGPALVIVYWIGSGTVGSGNLAITASEANTRWEGCVVKVPAGEFNSTTPISATYGTDSQSSDTTAPATKAFTTGSDTAQGKLCGWIGVDQDPLTGTASGWTVLYRNDRGRASAQLTVRDAATTASEAVSAAAYSIAGDSWASVTYVIRPPATSPYEDARQAAIDGIVSAQSEANGWNAERSNIPVTALVRTSDTVITLTIPSLPNYDITAQEVLTWTIPASILTGGIAIVATPTWTIDPTEGGTAYTRVLSESLGLSDSVSRVVGINRIASDPVGLTDSVSRSVGLNRIASDALGLTDSAARYLSLIRQAVDVLGITDSSWRTVSFLREAQELLGITDEELVQAAYIRILSETLGLTDSTSRSAGFARQATDTVGLSDSMQRYETMARFLSDILGITDSVPRYVTFLREEQEILGINDAELIQAAYIRLLSESLGLTDSAFRSVVHFREATDAIGISDSVSSSLFLVIYRVLTETMGLTDAAERYATFLRDAQEVLGITDEEVRQVGHNRFLSDSMGLADSAWRSQGHIRVNTESMGITDSLNVLLFLLIYRTVSETMGITDSQDRSHAAVRTISDALGISDTLDKASAINRIMSELMGMTDSVDRTVDMIRTVSDQIDMTDSAHRALTHIRFITDALGITDSNVASISVLVWLMIALSLQRMVHVEVANPFVSVEAISPRMIALNTSASFADISIYRPFITLEAYKL